MYEVNGEGGSHCMGAALNFLNHLSHISGNLNQIVKRANELAVAGLLTGRYISQVLLPEIENTQKILNPIYQELTKITPKTYKQTMKLHF